MTTKSVLLAKKRNWQPRRWMKADPDANDATLARIVVEYMTSHPPPYCPSVFHDVRPSALRRIERMRKIWPDWQPSNAVETPPAPVRCATTGIIRTPCGSGQIIAKRHGVGALRRCFWATRSSTRVSLGATLPEDRARLRRSARGRRAA
jgi:hypothetical protein